MKKIIIYVLIYSAVIFSAFAQKLPEKGVPLLKNFSPTDYNNKGKIWNIKSAENGIIYMAANKGLLEYDGKKWKCFKGSEGITRSLLIENDSVIYTGSDLDFGIWQKNKYQDFEYKSLYPFHEDLNGINEEFWNVHKLQNSIIFVSSNNIYAYNNQQFTKISAPSKFIGNFLVNDSLYLADEKNGLYVFNDFSLKHLFNFPEKENFCVLCLYKTDKEIIVVTKNNGLFTYSSGKLNVINNILSENLKTAKVFSFENINNKYLAFGTILNGLYITDIEGNIIHHINKNKGLANNTILSLHYSNSGKLWLGTDFGITSLDLKNDITYFYDYRGDFGTAYTALLNDEIFYLGTNQGLYYSKWDDLNDAEDFNKFQLIPNSEGQVWALQNIDNDIFVGHDLGLFILKNNTVQKICNKEGVWTILKYKDYLLTGNYNGICIFKKENNDWIFWKKMELILGSCNQIIQQNDSILWINIPNYGIIRVVLDDDLYPTQREIYPVSYFEGDNLNIRMKNNDIEVFTDIYIYKFSEEDFNFKKIDEKTNFPNIESLLVDNFQLISLNSDYEFYQIFNGFALKFLGNTEYQKNENYSLTLRKIEAFNNDEKTIFYQNAEIPYRLNNLKIGFIVANQDEVQYQYKLDKSEKWSEWSNENSIDFLNLKYGKHKIYIEANVNGEISNVLTVSFSISPPWYHSWYALIFYFILLILIVYLIYYWQKITLKKQKKLLLIKQQNALRQQAEKHEKEIIRLEQERLQAEYNQMKQQLKNKTIELANKAKENEDKNKLLLSLKEKAETAQNNPPLTKMKLKEMCRLLEDYFTIEDKTFEIQMDELHQEFFRKLREAYPLLSNNDLRMCAYLKIGLNSKEIAEMLNILPSSFYISRSRLRKKLNLKIDEDLAVFLCSIE